MRKRQSISRNNDGLIVYNKNSAVKYLHLTALFYLGILYVKLFDLTVVGRHDRLIYLSIIRRCDMEERVLTSLLIDFYGPLLTDKQRQCLELHHEDDMSLGEIAEELGVSRQAVHDNLQRAMQLLNGYEEKLHLVSQYEKRESILEQVRTALTADVISKTEIQSLLARMEG